MATNPGTTEQQARELIAEFLAAYPNLADMEDDRLEGIARVWIRELAPVPYDLAYLAVREILREREIPAFPAVGLIIRKATRLHLGFIPTALEGFYQAKEALRIHGERGAVRALGEVNKISAAVLQMMGPRRMWWEFCSVEPKDPDKMRADFIAYYEKELARAVEVTGMLPETRKRLGLRAPRRREIAPAQSQAIEGSAQEDREYLDILADAQHEKDTALPKEVGANGGRS